MTQFNMQEIAKYQEMNAAFQLFLEQQRDWYLFLNR